MSGGVVRAALALLATVLAGCAQVDAADPPPARPLATPSTVEDRCHVAVPGTLVQISTDDGSVVTGASFSDGTDAAILLHQDSRSGLCGFVVFARWAAQHGVRVLAFDICGYGKALCNDGLRGDPVAQQRAMIDYARADGARQVTVVGASMGGALAMGVGQRAGADAVVNLSGPPYWRGVPDAVSAARATTIPLLVAAAASDRGISPSTLRAAVKEPPARPKRYLAVPKGHGTGVLRTKP